MSLVYMYDEEGAGAIYDTVQGGPPLVCGGDDHLVLEELIQKFADARGATITWKSVDRDELHGERASRHVFLPYESIVESDSQKRQDRERIEALKAELRTLGEYVP